MNFYPSISVKVDVLVLKLKRGNELKERKTKVKTKVWKDVDEVVKASTIPKKLRWYEREMIVVPKGEKASS
nr:MAG TPA: hypothetical protein [Caudoviricetes sp.]